MLSISEFITKTNRVKDLTLFWQRPTKRFEGIERIFERGRPSHHHPRSDLAIFGLSPDCDIFDKDKPIYETVVSGLVFFGDSRKFKMAVSSSSLEETEQWSKKYWDGVSMSDSSYIEVLCSQSMIEASLSGQSRSGQMSNWDYYVVGMFEKGMTLSIEKNTSMIDKNKTVLSTLKKNDQVEVIDTNLVKIGNSSYAQVKYKRDIGLVTISALTKPTKNKQANSVVGGGKNSKEFTPDKLGLGGSEFTRIGSLVGAVSSALKRVYGGSEYKEIRRYLSDTTKKITGQSLNEKVERYSVSFKPAGSYNIVDSDMKIISKNFGEVIGAMYLLKHNKNAKVVGFPGQVNEGLYDIYTKDKKDRIHYYSAKSAGGSSTSLANLNFIKRNFAGTNTFIQKHMSEMEVIDSLINSNEYNTIYNITAFFNDNLQKKVKEIVSILNTLSMPDLQIADIEQPTLNDWFDSVRLTRTSDEFVAVMNKIYATVFDGLSKTTDKVLRQMFESDRNTHSNGYLLYPMGSYIVKYLNSIDKYVEALNLLTGFASYISQITVNMSSSLTEIQIIKFSKNRFKFTYNGMSNSPGNRPIGFKEQ
jgi:hypothetical protein